MRKDENESQIEFMRRVASNVEQFDSDQHEDHEIGSCLQTNQVEKRFKSVFNTSNRFKRWQ